MINREKDGKHFLYHLYKRGVYNEKCTIEQLMEKPECVVDKGLLANRLSDLFGGKITKNLKSVYDCMSYKKVACGGYQKLEKYIDTTNRDEFIDFMQLLPVGSLAHTIKF